MPGTRPPQLRLLLLLTNGRTLAIDKGEKVVCTFSDLRKPFDVIEHTVLISKLLKRGVSGNELTDELE